MSWWIRVLGMLIATGLAMTNMGCDSNQSAEYEALQAQITQMQQQLIGAQTERAEWQAKHLESTQALAAARQELETLTNESGPSSQQLATQQAQCVAELSQMRTQYNATSQQLQETQATLRQAQEQLAVRQSEQSLQVATPAESATTLTAIRQELSQLKEEIAAARQEHQAAHLEAPAPALDQLRQTAQEATTERDDLRAQLTQVRTEFELAQAERDEARQTLETARAETSDQACQTQLRQRRTELDAAHQQLSTQQGKIWEKTGQTRKMKEQVAQQLQESIQANIVTLQQDEDELQIRIGGRILFNPGAVTLRPQGRQTLDQIARVLQNYPDYTIQVEGHTDNDPVTNANRKCWPTNWELSALRSASAARHLETQNIASERLGIVGLAYHQPLASNDTPSGKAQNRRIEIRVRPSPR